MVVTDSNTKFVDKAGMDHAIDELKKYIDGMQPGSIDLSDYVTQEQLQEKLDALNIDIDLSIYATKEELQDAIKEIDLSGFATTAYVDDKVANIPTNGEIDLTDYYTKTETYNKTEVDNLIPTVTDGKNGVDGKDGANGKDGVDGQDGFSPVATVTKSGNVATITITDKNGTTTASVSDGKDGSGGSAGGGEVYSTEETAIGTWIDGKTIYRKVITMDLPAVASGQYFAQKKIVEEPCNIMLLNWRAISYAGLTGSNYDFTSNILSGDGMKGAEVWTTKTTVNAISQTLDKSKLSVFHVGNPASSYINCYYGSSFASKRCDFILEYIKVEAT